MSRTSYPAGKEKLLATAEHLFAETGFDGVTTKMLSNEAGLTVGAIYHHFDSKLSVYRAVLEFSLRKLPSAPANLLDDSGDMPAQLAELIAWFCALVSADTDPAKLLRRELLDPHMNVPLSDLEMFVKPLDRFRYLMARLAPQIDAELIQASIISLSFGISNLKGLTKLLPTASAKLNSPEQIALHIITLIFPRLESTVRIQQAS